MPEPRAYVGERWLIRGEGWRRIIARRRDKHGALYGIRSRLRLYPLYNACSVDRNWGRYVRSRDLIKPDRITLMERRRLRIRANRLVSNPPPEDGQEAGAGE